MKDKFIEKYSELYNHIDFTLSIRDIKDISTKNNLNVIHFCIKNGQAIFVDQIDESPDYLSSEFLLLLQLVATKYPDLDVELLYFNRDFLDPCLYNLPVFCMANNPKKNVYNPVSFYEHVHTIKLFENRYQSCFSKKKTRVFGRYGITGFQGVNITNWINYYKVQFAIASLSSPHLIDIKFLFVPHDFNYWDDHINDTFSPDVKNIMLSLPIYDTTIKDLWTETIDQAFDSKVCIFNEGNSIASPGRILTCLHNDGVAIKIGRQEYQSVLDILIDSIDEKLVYSYHEKPDDKFYSSIDNSMKDDNYRICKNKIVNEYFNQKTMIDLTYEILKSYSVLVKK